MFPVWFNRELIDLTIKKKSLHRLYKSTLNPFDYVRFKAVRTQCKYLAEKCHNAYLWRVEESIEVNIKSFWSHVNSLKVVSTPSSRVYYESEEAFDSSSKCQLFADYFSSVFTANDVPVPGFDYGLNLSLSSCAFTASDVERKLEALDVNKSAGPDGIPPIALKFCSSVISPHLTILFQALLSNGVFPERLKHGYVIPIFKAGDRDNVKNYRPIVIQSTIAKVFESIVLDCLQFNLSAHIVSEQHGFFQGRSTVTNLLHLQENIMTAFLESRSVDCVYLDFAKAFDRVDHGILLAKLRGFGVCGPLLQWLSSYLKGRHLTVKYDNSASLPFPVLSGVPQGSHLGPLLFCIFINDIGGYIETDYLMFADDIKVFWKISSPQDCQLLQRTLHRINSWCMDNFMDLNITKCQVMTYARGHEVNYFDYQLNGVNLKRVHNVKDLGLIMSPNLNPQDHISHCVTRARALLGFIQRSTRDFRNTSALVTLYKSLVRPILEYGTVIWSPYQIGHIEALDGVQVRLVRLIGLKLGFPYLQTPVSVLETQFGLQPLKLRRIMFDLTFLFKLVNGFIDSPSLLEKIEIKMPLGTRSKSVFRRRYMPVYYAYNSGISRLLRVGGDAASQVDFFGTTVSKFKRDIKKMVMS